MFKPRWLLALPLALAASIGSARASSIHDNAKLFDAGTVREAQAVLDRIEAQSKLTTTIETIDTLDGESIDQATIEHAKASGTHGLFILIAKDEHKLEVRASKDYRVAFPAAREREIRNAIVDGFKKHDFNVGLMQGVEKIKEEVTLAKAENGGVLPRSAPVVVRRGGVPPGAGVPGRVGRPQQGFGLGSLLGIGLAIIAVLFVLRLIGGLFGAGRGGYAGPGRMGGPGYGAPGYGGGGGGGFMSSMFGGIGGALAGNWLYDQFSGRHHQGGSYMDTTGSAGQDVSPGDAGGDDWSGGTGVSGDWGGGDGGGGGDWGGGGGGDWGGGGGGGDW